MQSQRALYARESARECGPCGRARVYTGMRAFCAFPSLPFFSPFIPLFSSVLRSAFRVLCERIRAYVHIHTLMHARPPPSFFASLVLLYLRVYGVRRTRKRRALSSHGDSQFAYSLATSCNARRCPHLWASVSREYARIDGT